jgi:DNA-directed RNA polymerase subunit RPC12/RpoP
MGSDLTCPYGNCGKEFKQPILLSSEGELPVESYYACPHCHSKLDLVLKDSRNLGSVEAVVSTDVKIHVAKEDRPESCTHYVGYLKTLPEDAPIPERCLTCPSVMLCFARH